MTGTTARPTAASNAADINELRSAIGQILDIVQGQVQHATPGPVAEAVATPPAVEKVKTAGDLLHDYVIEKGLAFARGGRTYLSVEQLTAAVRVAKTGKPEVLPYDDGSKLAKRGVTHIAFGRDEHGSVITQFVYRPEQA